MSEARPYAVRVTRRAQKDISSLDARLRRKLAHILSNRIAVDPFSGRRLVGDLKGYWSVRLNIKDWIIYRIDEDARVVYILRARTTTDDDRFLLAKGSKGHVQHGDD